jgi:hypothetical protein
MEEAGAGPDAVVAGDFVDVSEGADGDGLADALVRRGRRVRAGVEGVDAVAVEEKGLSSPGRSRRPASRISPPGGGRRGSEACRGEIEGGGVASQGASARSLVVVESAGHATGGGGYRWQTTLFRLYRLR